MSGTVVTLTDGSDDNDNDNYNYIHVHVAEEAEGEIIGRVGAKMIPVAFRNGNEDTGAEDDEAAQEYFVMSGTVMVDAAGGTLEEMNRTLLSMLFNCCW